MLYAAHSAYAHTVKCKSGAVYSVRTVAVYPDTVRIPARVFTDKGSLLYSIEQISLGSAINGSEMLAEISRTFASNPSLALSEDQVVKLILAPLGRVRGDRKEFCRKIVSLGRSLFKDVYPKKALALIVGSTCSFLKLDEISCLLGGEETMLELADYISGGKLSAAEAEIEKAKAEAAEAKTKAEVAEAKAEVAEAKAKAEAADFRAKLEKSVFKMKMNNFDLPTISDVIGLSIDEIERILN
jgi:hypothetical protein